MFEGDVIRHAQDFLARRRAMRPEGVDLTLQCLRDKRADALRLTRITRQVDLGMPAVGAAQ